MKNKAPSWRRRSIRPKVKDLISCDNESPFTERAEALVRYWDRQAVHTQHSNFVTGAGGTIMCGYTEKNIFWHSLSDSVKHKHENKQVATETRMNVNSFCDYYLCCMFKASLLSFSICSILECSILKP